MEPGATLLFLLKVTLILLFAFSAARWYRSAPAARRHGVWSATFVALAVLPLLAIALPAIRVPVPAWRPTSITASVTESGAPLETGAPDRSMPLARQVDASPIFATEAVSADSRAPLPVAGILLSLWLAGALLALAWLTRSLIRVRRIVSLGRPVNDPAWKKAATRIACQLGLGSVPKLIVSDDVSVPMAGNIGGPTVLLPPDAAEWDAERRDVVLMHEMTHHAHRDPLRILGARVACALYWFHPLMWLAARRSAADCEQACDESLLARGVRPSLYAQLLLDFANVSRGPLLNVALPIVHRHRLETRVMAILTSDVPRALTRKVGSSRRASLAALPSVALILTIAAARPAETAAAKPVIMEPVSVIASPKSPTPSTNAAPAAAPNNRLLPIQGERCWNQSSSFRNFSGSSTTNNERITQRVGRLGRERVAQMTFGDDLRVCAITEGYDGPEDALPGDWIGRADRVVLETESGNDVRRLEISDGRTTWTMNGRVLPVDDGVRAWRGALLDLMDASWEISQLRGTESSLRGEISSTLGERSSLQGEISSLRGEVSSMQGEISSLRGEESSLRGEISSIRGQESSMRGQISSERGAISSLEAQRWERGADREAITSRIRRHEEAIRNIEADIARYDADSRVRAVERRIADIDTDRLVAAVERRIREFDVDARVAAVERRIANLDVDRHVRSIEREIGALDTDSRVRTIGERRDRALDRLRVVLRSR